jgi:hypothetical protein
MKYYLILTFITFEEFEEKSGRSSQKYCLVYSSILQMEATLSSETSVDLRLHGIISQNTELFVTTAVRISNPAFNLSE